MRAFGAHDVQILRLRAQTTKIDRRPGVCLQSCRCPAKPLFGKLGGR